MDTIAGYLLKTEPSAYSFADLQRDVETTWDGVTNPAAVKYLREMKKGAKCVIYHTGDERTVIGTCKVLSVDPTDPKAPVVRIQLGKPVRTPHTLAEIKTNPIFTQSPLVTQARLSVVPLNQAQWDWLTLS